MSISDARGYTLAQALGKNLFNRLSIVAGFLNTSDGSIVSIGDGSFTSTHIAVSGIVSMTASVASTTDLRHSLACYDSDKAFLGMAYSWVGVLTASFVTLAGTKFVRLSVVDDATPDRTVAEVLALTTPQLELGSSSTTYEAWEGIYKDEALTIPYADGQPIGSLYLGDGQWSIEFCKGWVSTGHYILQFPFRIKHQVDYGVALLNDVEKGDFPADYATVWTDLDGVLSVSNNTASVTGDGSGTQPQAQQLTIDTYVGQELFVYSKAKVTNSLAGLMNMRIFNGTTVKKATPVLTPTINVEYVLGGILTMTEIGATKARVDILSEYADAGTANGKVMEVNGTAGVFAINMTELGIESWSEAQMLTAVQEGYFDDYKIFPTNYDTDPYSLQLAQNYPLVQSADLTDTLVDDHTLDEPTNQVLTVKELEENYGNQLLFNYYKETVELNNEVINGDFSSGTTGWSNVLTSSFSVTSGIASFTASSQNGRIYNAGVNTSGDIVFLTSRINATSSLIGLSYTGGGASLDYHTGGGTYEVLGAKRTTASDNELIVIKDERSSSWNAVLVDWAMSINMTDLNIEHLSEAEMLALVQQGYFEGYTDIITKFQLNSVAFYKEPYTANFVPISTLTNTSTSDYLKVGYDKEIQAFYKEVDSVKEYSITWPIADTFYYIIVVKNDKTTILEYKPSDLTTPSKILFI